MRKTITSKELYFAIFFAIFALVSWSEVLYLLEYCGILPKSNDPYAALRPQWKEGQVALLADLYEVLNYHILTYFPHFIKINC